MIDRLIDLHLHLDGAITVQIAKQLAKIQGLDLPSTDDVELEKRLTVSADCKDLNDFLKCFDLPLSLMQTKVGIAEAVRLVAETIQSQGIIYAEIRFAPQLHLSKGLTQDEVVSAALEGLTQTQLKANLILCCMRGEGNEEANLETLCVAKKHLVEDGGVVAVDLAGAESLYKTEKYRSLFENAKTLGIPFTIHAGEAAGAESIKHAIEFGAHRIGHGVRLSEDPKVYRLVKEKGIPLEMCPTSNRQTCAIEDMTKYPLLDYLCDGLKVTINTDDMAIEGTTLKDEYLFMQDAFGMTQSQAEQTIQNAIEAAFTSEKTKAFLRLCVRGE